MARIRIDLPSSFIFTTEIPIRITDVNYGGHMGNDALLSIIHEARMQFLKRAGYTEINFAGSGLIMADVGIIFKQEAFYGDTLSISLAIDEVSKVSFEVLYKIEKMSIEKDGDRILVAKAKTGMVCYNYQLKKVAELPAEALKQLGLPTENPPANTP